MPGVLGTLVVFEARFLALFETAAKEEDISNLQHCHNKLQSSNSKRTNMEAALGSISVAQVTSGQSRFVSWPSTKVKIERFLQLLYIVLNWVD